MVKAIVSYPPDPRMAWKLGDVTPVEPKESELLVRVIACGICHTDVHMTQLPATMKTYPCVVGHEGAGYVEKAGSKVKVANVGDAVCLSYDSCGECKKCQTGHPAFCDLFIPLNLPGEPGRFQGKDDAKIAGKFFGQSSFSSLTVAQERTVVNVSHVVKNDDELKLLAPFGCGLQTGSGAITEVARASSEDSVTVVGLGGVGLSAIMAAKLRGCHPIVAVDIVDAKLEFAKTVGATHVINSSTSPDGFADKIKAAIGDEGTSITVDTTGIKKVINDGYEATSKQGQLLLVGSPQGDDKFEIPMSSMVLTGKIIRGVCEGDCTPSEHIPQMIKWHREGKFPVEKIIKFYPAEKFQDALADMHSGSTVKPILLW